jgi:uncharacterized protein YcfL
MASMPQSKDIEYHTGLKNKTQSDAAYKYSFHWKKSTGLQSKSRKSFPS